MKLPFEYVSRHVDELFSKSENLTDDAEIDKSCQLVSAFIIACGWDETEFWKIMYGINLPIIQEKSSQLN
jgi:hypothetical protein